MKKKHEMIDERYYDDIIYSDDAKIKVSTSLDSRFQKYRISKVLQIYKPNKNDRVLDLGCGWGTFSFAVAPLCKEVTGIDFSRRSIELCNQLLRNKQYSNVRFVCANAQDTGLESGSYDVIICADLFEHLYAETFSDVLDECKRLLEKGGKLVIWTPHRGHLFEILKNHNIVLRKDTSHVDYKCMHRILHELRRRQFLIKKKYYAESHVPILRTLERLLLPILPTMRRRIAVLAEKS